MPPLGDARERFYVKFYLVAMLFIVFDIEMVFMMPWAVAFRQLGPVRRWASPAGPGGDGWCSSLILAVGYVYVWKRGALEWD